MDSSKRLSARFFVLKGGRTPVREWLLALTINERKRIGDDIRTAEFGWPMGMPICRKIKGYKGLWEIRTNLQNNKIARVIFCIHQDEMILLHGFIKKTQKTPKFELEIAVNRMKGLT